MSVSHRRIGYALQAQGNLAAAQKEFQASSAIMTELVAKDAANAGWQRDLATSGRMLSDVEEASGNAAGGLEDARAALARIAAVTNDPSPDDTQQELARIQRTIAAVLRAQGDDASALAADREAARIMNELAAKAPAHAAWHRDLAVSHGKVGLDLLAEGDTGDARMEIGAGLAIMTRLAVLDPTNAIWQQDLSELHRENGDAAKATSDRARAGAEYEACAGIPEPMVSRGSTNTKLAELVAYCHLQMIDQGGIAKPSSAQ